MSPASRQPGERDPLLPKDVTTPQEEAAPDAGQQVYTPGASPAKADSSREAWLFLAACWVVEAFVFGFGLSFGVFQDYYSSHPPFAGANNIAAIGTTTTGILYMGTPLVIALCRRLPHAARWFTLAGLLVASLSLAASSMCVTVPQLIAVLGVPFGLAGCFAFCPCIIYIDQWFIKRKSLAMGIMFSAGGFGGVVFPPLLERMLRELGFASTMQIWAGVTCIATVPLAYYIKPRQIDTSDEHTGLLSMRCLGSRVFALYQLANLIQAAGYFLPAIYLPLYARVALNASDTQSVLALIVLNCATTIGCVAMGALADHWHPTTCGAVSALGATLSTALLWGFSSSLPALYTFCVAYGLFAGGWPSIWPEVMSEVARRAERAGHGYTDPLAVYSLLVLGRGIGNMVSGPLSDWLVHGAAAHGHSGIGYAGVFGPMIAFTSVTGLLSGMNLLWKYFGWL
ncbi:MFS general substrate transporter [Pseudovirgaria hyperparasitica]|uniref:MFS general substrate transporter n=1 Tax=Pseudovirgaria hyperparasitica TaxID=470096 RepID=A0A6A6W9V9_9PEZI|nr:MFS general substrate transporter [Pseudovirgaria hyperparasitica]KAF2758814.1 MFS general substrate transporter [Pseudovirgaria hyperparasitica]